MRLEKLQDPLFDAVVGYGMLAFLGGMYLLGERTDWESPLPFAMLGLFLVLAAVYMVALAVQSRRGARAWDERMQRLGYAPMPGERGLRQVAGRYRPHRRALPDGTEVLLQYVPGAAKLQLAVRSPWGETRETTLPDLPDDILRAAVERFAMQTNAALPAEPVILPESSSPALERMRTAAGLLVAVSTLAIFGLSWAGILPFDPIPPVYAIILAWGVLHIATLVAERRRRRGPANL